MTGDRDARPAREETVRQVARQIQNELTWRFLGLEIGRKTEILALAAFLLSVSGVVWQVNNYMRGAVIRLFPSEQVTLSSSRYLGRDYPGEPDQLRLIATLSYVNEGDAGQNGTIRGERIRFAFGGRTYEHRGYQFVSSDVENGKPVARREGEARPFPVTAGSSLSHETLFTPWEVECPPQANDCKPALEFLEWDAFIEAVARSRYVDVATVAQILGGKPIEAHCRIGLRDWEIQVLRKEKWLTAVCHEKKS